MTRNDRDSATDPLAAVRADHGCFGCGDRNPFGLHLKFTTTPDGVRARIVPLVEHQGFENVIHGGIISTVLDEAMAWATAAAGAWAVTGEMCIRFRAPLRVGQATTVSASIESQRARLISATATLARDADGATIATASASFLRVDRVTADAWRQRYLVPDAGADAW